MSRIESGLFDAEMGTCGQSAKHGAFTTALCVGVLCQPGLFIAFSSVETLNPKTAGRQPANKLLWGNFSEHIQPVLYATPRTGFSKIGCLCWYALLTPLLQCAVGKILFWQLIPNVAGHCGHWITDRQAAWYVDRRMFAVPANTAERDVARSGAGIIMIVVVSAIAYVC